MNEVYAVKQTQFLGKPVRYVCQNANGPCPLLAIANVLLLRGQLSLEGVVEAPGSVSAHNLIHLVHHRLLDTNPPLSNAGELQRLTQEKTLKDVEELLPTMLVGLDVNVQFHNITDFEYTVACAVFDMLDIVLVHGWLLDKQDNRTMKVVGNKSYNELIERLVDYRGVLMTEKAIETERPIDMKKMTEETVVINDKGEEQALCTAATSRASPLATETTGIQNLSIDVNCTHAFKHTLESSNLTTSMISPKKSPSQQTVETMMMERHISDADALDTATTLLEEGPILEEFFKLSANQLTYYGLVKLHEGLRERQLCVFFRNNHFSTLFKFEGALYLLVTDAGYLEEPTVVWELLNGIDGDTAYLNAQFSPVTSSEHQKNILTQQLKHRDQKQNEEQGLRKESDTGRIPLTSGELMSCGSNTSKDVDQMLLGGGQVDEDYLLALKIQREEELACGNKKVSSSVSSCLKKPIEIISNTTGELKGQDDADSHRHETSDNDSIPVSANGQVLLLEEELEAQRQAERFYQEKKRQIDAQTRLYQQEEDWLQQQQFQQQSRGVHKQRQTSDGSDCNVS